jgi:hypothetical protein
MELALRRQVRKRDAPPSFAERVAHRAGVAVPSVVLSSAFGEDTFDPANRSTSDAASVISHNPGKVSWSPAETSFRQMRSLYKKITPR